MTCDKQKDHRPAQLLIFISRKWCLSVKIERKKNLIFVRLIFLPVLNQTFRCRFKLHEWSSSIMKSFCIGAYYLTRLFSSESFFRHSAYLIRWKVNYSIINSRRPTVDNIWTLNMWKRTFNNFTFAILICRIGHLFTLKFHRQSNLLSYQTHLCMAFDS